MVTRNIVAVGPPAVAEGEGLGVEGGLTPTEHEILMAVAAGTSVAEIAKSFRTSEDGIGVHVANVLVKLHREHAARLEPSRSRARNCSRGSGDDMAAHARRWLVGFAHPFSGRSLRWDEHELLGAGLQHILHHSDGPDGRAADNHLSANRRLGRWAGKSDSNRLSGLENTVD